MLFEASSMGAADCFLFLPRMGIFALEASWIKGAFLQPDVPAFFLAIIIAKAFGEGNVADVVAVPGLDLRGTLLDRDDCTL